MLSTERHVVSQCVWTFGPGTCGGLSGNGIRTRVTSYMPAAHPRAREAHVHGRRKKERESGRNRFGVG
eukprot:2107523-Rhodomonas_salina.1